MENPLKLKAQSALDHSNQLVQCCYAIMAERKKLHKKAIDPLATDRTIRNHVNNDHEGKSRAR